MEVRLALEPEAARLAAKRRKPEDIARINAACKALEDSVFAGEAGQAHDLAFHKAVGMATGNELFVRQLEGLDVELKGFMSVSLGLTGLGSAERKEAVTQEHKQIAEAIAVGEGDLAETYMHYHLAQARRRLTDMNNQP
jgi:GntR family transcriptional repressor for pyruvate dehydrogenase complex